MIEKRGRVCIPFSDKACRGRASALCAFRRPNSVLARILFRFDLHPSMRIDLVENASELPAGFFVSKSINLMRSDATRIDSEKGARHGWLHAQERP